ncbi:hypothetical protein TOPH_03486 [Tolypocladium ophioglossoides CBS 100239]|uniref:Uncharacterized protein n=1 Tax=Tolypocladium ophioglossoides (strain CBS 100239) TaxID=1163406 RepID=A0A0L0NCM5_TOLOC|nr:hypothetical protein TOPH_03486 [Tolypocladium ophioglossoides CBS 100239]
MTGNSLKRSVERIHLAVLLQRDITTLLILYLPNKAARICSLAQKFAPELAVNIILQYFYVTTTRRISF